MLTQSAIDGASQSLTNPGNLGRYQRSDPFLSKVKPSLLREKIPSNDPDQHIHEEYPVDDKDLLWYAPLGGIPVMPRISR